MTYLVDTNVLLRTIQVSPLVAAMLAHRVTHLLTFNTDEFKRYDEITVVNPSSIK